MPDPRSLIGNRVTLRHRIASADIGSGPHSPSMTDVVGRVLAADPDLLTLQRRDGSIVQVPTAAVVHLRTVADRPLRAHAARAIDPEDLMRVSSLGWPAVISAPLGDWELRSSAGYTQRACSVSVHGEPQMPLSSAASAIQDFYTEHGLPPLAQVIVESPWYRALNQLGWVDPTADDANSAALVLVTDLPADPTPDTRVRLADRADRGWLSMHGRISARQLDAALQVLHGPYLVRFASITGDAVGRAAPTTDPAEEPLAIGRVVVTGEWAGITAMATSPKHRRQGYARAIVESCLAWAVQQGATRAQLQVVAGNRAARALYESFGFELHHSYRYLRPS